MLPGHHISSHVPATASDGVGLMDRTDGADEMES
jgi:hypothetical protein